MRISSQLMSIGIRVTRSLQRVCLRAKLRKIRVQLWTIYEKLLISMQFHLPFISLMGLCHEARITARMKNAGESAGSCTGLALVSVSTPSTFWSAQYTPIHWSKTDLHKFSLIFHHKFILRCSETMVVAPVHQETDTQDQGMDVHAWYGPWEVVKLAYRPNVGSVFDTFNTLSIEYASPFNPEGHSRIYDGAENTREGGRKSIWKLVYEEPRDKIYTAG
ncbi:uncharacterized protein EV420DRAFT_1477248 [Desarmillaria tabescens]|uniref:Uncharacterized protein n=1 Tax=Armillaria tabescens TaxID=1929756 RepID=A0AA39NBL0_ARMTA|nr:uncharacterized protein EV420DRAFT_1477248 [Desarmillaria tabescens]KAK0462544.1 hypothetical protein EV420DRAFT_1477248 [Desarmillaria tabescens]